jgi:hypothetical protein
VPCSDRARVDDLAEADFVAAGAVDHAQWDLVGVESLRPPVHLHDVTCGVDLGHVADGVPDGVVDRPALLNELDVAAPGANSSSAVVG